MPTVLGLIGLRGPLAAVWVRCSGRPQPYLGRARRESTRAIAKSAPAFALVVLLAAVPLLGASAQAGPGRPSTEALNAKLDSIEAAALACEKSDRRFSLVAAIAAAGSVQPGPEAVPPPPYPGIVARLSRIYQACDDYGTRHAIVSVMQTQAERDAAVAFLAEAAQEAPSPATGGVLSHDTEFPLPYEAVGILARLGSEGRAALQRLLSEGTVRDPAARRLLEGMAREGFPEHRR